MPTAVILLDFDPLIRIGETSVRLATVALAAVIAFAIVLAGQLAASTPERGDPDQPFSRRPGLRRDDLLFIVLGAVPGAVIGGRLDYVLSHLPFYAARPEAILDPASGSLGLGLAVVGGILTGGIVVRLLDAPVGRWAHVAAAPVLVTIAGGRLAQILSGDGQGLPSGAAWATSYVGPGPWGSIAPSIAAHPSQAYEGILTLVALLVVAAFLATGGFDRRDGRALALAVGLWAAIRFGVAATWQDPPALSILNAGQLIAAGIVVLCGVALVVGLSREDRPRADGGVPRTNVGREGLDAERGSVEWPDPATRPRF